RVHRPRVAAEHSHDGFGRILVDTWQTRVKLVHHVGKMSKVPLRILGLAFAEIPDRSCRIAQIRLTRHLLDKALKATVDGVGSRQLHLPWTHLLVDVVGDCLGFLGRVKRRLGALLPPAEHVLDSLLDVVPASETLAKKAAPSLRHMAKSRQSTDTSPE